MNHLLENITRTAIRLMLKEPFYGHYFSTIVKEVSNEVPTIGVAIGREDMLRLVVNPQFWKEVLIKEDYQDGVLKHEILHIVFKHILMVGQFDYKEIANIAMDIVVNQYIERSQLPGEPVLLENYPVLQLRLGESVEYYYEKLLAVYKNPKESVSAEQLKRDITRHDFLAANRTGGHQTWKKLSAGERRIFSAAINQSIFDVMMKVKLDTSYEKLPAGLRTYFEKIEQSAIPTVNWRRVLRLFTDTSTQTYLKNTTKRPSKRYGSVPGIKVKRRNKILVAIDTSGSVSGRELVTFWREIHHIFRQGAEITVVECDTQIRNHYLYRGILPDFVMGRGGTNFNAPIRFANEDYMPDALIYFTDGYAPSPQVLPRMPILWMITKEGMAEEKWKDFPGRKVRMEERN